MADSINADEVHKMKVSELKKVLKDKGMSTSGNKTELIDRLLAVGESVSDSSDKELLEEDRLLDDSSDILADSPVKVADPTSATASVATKVSKPVPVKPASSSKLTPVTFEAAGAAGDANVTKQSTSSASGKVESRLKRFGVVSEDARKTARMERFLSNSASGSAKPTTTVSPDKPAANGNALQKRAERFGVAASAANTVQQKAIAVPSAGTNDRLQKRAERFGQVSSAAGISPKGDEQERILKRKARFGSSSGAKLSSDGAEDDEQKKRRLERFGAVAVK